MEIEEKDGVATLKMSENEVVVLRTDIISMVLRKSKKRHVPKSLEDLYNILIEVFS